MNHSLWRDNETQRRYKKYVADKPADAQCEFCGLQSGDGQVLRDEDTFWVTKNIFPYTAWDSFYVDEHLMLIPKRHLDSLSGLTADELTKFSSSVAEYEDKGYSVYGRAATNGAKSIAHQHTHLIKVSNRRVKTLIFLRRFGLTWFW